MSDSPDDKPGTYIGGVYHTLADKNAPEPRRPSEAEEMDRALDRLEDRRAGAESFDRDDYIETPEPRRAFKNADAAAEHLRHEGEQIQEATKFLEQENARQEDEQAQRGIREAADWHPDDAAVLNGLTARVQQFNSDAATFTAAYQRAQAMQAAGQHVEYAVQQQLQETATRLAAEKAALQQAGQKVRHAADIKTAEAARRALYRDVPELKDPKNREALIERAVKEGYTRQEIESFRDSTVVRRAWKLFERERAAEKEAHINRAREPLFRAGPLAAGGRVGDKMTPEEAHDRLRKTGSMLDAANTLTLRRERERDRRDG